MDSNAIRSKAALAVSVIAVVLGVAGSAFAGGWHDLLATESFHLVGAPGEPALGNGGQGDCLWGAPQATTLAVSGVNPPAFYRDPVGTVHLVGVTEPVNGPGGDGACGGADAVEDLVAFRLPNGYRPENVELATGGGHLVLVAPDEGATIGGEAVPAGAVIPVDGLGLAILDGITFRAAGPGTQRIDSDPQSLAPLRELERELD